MRAKRVKRAEPKKAAKKPAYRLITERDLQVLATRSDLTALALQLQHRLDGFERRTEAGSRAVEKALGIGKRPFVVYGHGTYRAASEHSSREEQPRSINIASELCFLGEGERGEVRLSLGWSGEVQGLTLYVLPPALIVQADIAGDSLLANKATTARIGTPQLVVTRLDRYSQIRIVIEWPKDAP